MEDRPAGLTFQWINDDVCEVQFGARHLMDIDHDTFDRGAMEAVVKALTRLAELSGMPVAVLGTPGV